MFYTHPHYLNWKLYYKLFFGLLITCTLIGFWIDGLVTGVSDFQYNGSFDRGDYTVNYFSYFTTLSNVFVAYWLFGTSLFFWKRK